MEAIETHFHNGSFLPLLFTVMRSPRHKNVLRLLYYNDMETHRGIYWRIVNIAVLALAIIGLLYPCLPRGGFVDGFQRQDSMSFFFRIGHPNARQPLSLLDVDLSNAGQAP